MKSKTKEGTHINYTNKLSPHSTTVWQIEGNSVPGKDKWPISNHRYGGYWDPLLYTLTWKELQAESRDSPYWQHRSLHTSWFWMQGSSAVDASAGLNRSFRWLCMFSSWVGGCSPGTETMVDGVPGSCFLMLLETPHNNEHKALSMWGNATAVISVNPAYCKIPIDLTSISECMNSFNFFSFPFNSGNKRIIQHWRFNVPFWLLSNWKTMPLIYAALILMSWSFLQRRVHQVSQQQGHAPFIPGHF